ncbi:MAG TPA: HRDC domain-containing protein, partial [Fibrobacteria bacterium]|nr:HRDC domain-containing protein [Fibrobacteria bacterium]
EKVVKFGHDKLPTFGVGKDIAKPEWLAIFRQLASQDLLGVNLAEHGQVVLTAGSWEVLRGKRTVALRRVEPKARRKATKVLTSDRPADPGLFQSLRALRRELALEQGVPPFVVFSDKSLLDMVRIRPTDELEFSQVHGVGGTKARRYGERFLEAIRAG